MVDYGVRGEEFSFYGKKEKASPITEINFCLKAVISREDS